MDKTCPRCGFARAFCQCGRKKNTSGEPVRFQHYDNSKAFSEDFSTTSRFKRPEDKAEKKFMEELNPTENEEVPTWIQRCQIGVHNLNSYAHAQHLWMTSKGIWACHKTSRYCFICTQTQHLELLLMMAEAVHSIVPLNSLRWHLSTDDHNYTTYSIDHTSTSLLSSNL